MIEFVELLNEEFNILPVKI